MKKIFLFAALSASVFFENVSFASKAPTATVVSTPIVSTPETSKPEEVSPGEIKAALDEFKSLSRQERKDRIKAAKKELKLFKQEQKAGNAPSTNTLLLVILAILIPPLAVYLHQGKINNKFWISLILTLLFFIPGMIYSLIVVLGGA